MKSGSLSFLEPSGPLQACNETALPFNNESYIFRRKEVEKKMSCLAVASPVATVCTKTLCIFVFLVIFRTNGESLGLFIGK